MDIVIFITITVSHSINLGKQSSLLNILIINMEQKVQDGWIHPLNFLTFILSYILCVTAVELWPKFTRSSFTAYAVFSHGVGWQRSGELISTTFMRIHRVSVRFYISFFSDLPGKSKMTLSSDTMQWKGKSEKQGFVGMPTLRNNLNVGISPKVWGWFSLKFPVASDHIFC